MTQENGARAGNQALQVQFLLRQRSLSEKVLTLLVDAPQLTTQQAVQCLPNAEGLIAVLSI